MPAAKNKTPWYAPKPIIRRFERALPNPRIKVRVGSGKILKDLLTPFSEEQATIDILGRKTGVIKRDFGFVKDLKAWRRNKHFKTYKLFPW